jgi:hypothetical protein
MKTWISAPIKNQVILICSITTYLFLRLLVATDFLTNEKFSNSQYLIFGILITLGFAISSVAFILYRTNKTAKAS